jgi:cell division protein FtsB
VQREVDLLSKLKTAQEAQCALNEQIADANKQLATLKQTNNTDKKEVDKLKKKINELQLALDAERTKVNSAIRSSAEYLKQIKKNDEALKENALQLRDKTTVCDDIYII